MRSRSAPWSPFWATSAGSSVRCRGSPIPIRRFARSASRWKPSSAFWTPTTWWPIRPGAADVAPLRGEVEFRGRQLRLPAGVAVLRGINLTVRPGETVALVGPQRQRKDHAGHAAPAVLPRHRGHHHDRRGRHPGHDPALASEPDRRGVPGRAPVQRYGSGQHRLRTPAMRPRRKSKSRPGRHRPMSSSWPYREGYDTIVRERGTRLSGGPAPADCHRPRPAQGPAHPYSGRGHVGARRRIRASDPARAQDAASGPHRIRDRAPALHRAGCRPDRGDQGRGDFRGGNSRRAVGARRATTPRW